jgi:hypothetical protein
MRKEHPMTLISSSSAVALLVMSAALAAGAQTSTVRYSLDQPVSNQAYLNECNGESVVMNGTMHYDYFFSSDPANDHTDYHLVSSTKLTGVGQSTGAQYIGNNSTNYHTVTKGTAASNFSSAEKTRLVAQGPTPNMFLTQTLHVVIDAKGNIHADTSNAKISCK